MSWHPSDAEIHRLENGRLESGERLRVERHVAGCALCQSRTSEPAATLRDNPEGAARVPNLFSEATERFASVIGDVALGKESSTPDEPMALDPNASFDIANVTTQKQVGVALVSFTAGRRPERPAARGSDPDATAVGETPLRRSAPEARALVAGERVNQFEVIKLIGRGGLGEVYLAKDTRLSRSVALKIVRAERLGSRAVVQRFLFEARATAQFNHPNIVTIHDVGEYKGSPYFALEYLDGSSLGQRMRKERIPELEALQIAHQIASALKQAHKSGVVHRDLKPDNVFLPHEGPVRVLDFGMGKLVQRDDADGLAQDLFSHIEPTQAGLVVGTPAYMAPEQWVGAAVMPATDVFALGLISFAMLTGQRAYGELRKTEEYRNAALSPEPLPAIALLSTLRPSLAMLVERCLEKKPERRPSADDVIAALRVIMNEDFDLAVVSDPRILPQRFRTPRPAERARLPTVDEETRASEQAPASEAEGTYSSFIGRPSLAEAHEPTQGGDREQDRTDSEEDLTDHTLTLMTENPAVLASSASAASPAAAFAVRAPAEERSAARSRTAVAVGLSVVLLLLTVVVVATLARGGAGGDDDGSAAGTAIEVTQLAPAKAPDSAALVDERGAPEIGSPTPPTALREGTKQPTPIEAAPVAQPLEEPVEKPVAQPVAQPVAKSVAKPVEEAAVDKSATPEPQSQRPAQRAQPRTMTIDCQAPSSVTWRTLSGGQVGRGSGPCRVPPDTTVLLAKDRVSGGVSRVPVVGKTASLDALGRGEVWFQVKPYADVKLGNKKLGVTPFEPVALVAGSYTATLTFNDTVRKERFEIRSGEVTRVRVHMQAAAAGEE